MPNPNHTPWSAEEEEALIEVYSSWPMDPSKFHPQTLQRSSAAVWNKASKLGISNRRLAPVEIAATPTEWAYLAGFIDADGHIGWKARSRQAVIDITNTDLRIHNWLADRFPGTLCYEVSPERMNAYQSTSIPHRKPIRHTTWQRRDNVKAILEGVMPYLQLKKEKAEMVYNRFGNLGYTGSN